MATNVSNLPQSGYTNTAVARITKMALQRMATDPILNRFMKNDASFNRDLDKSFERGDVANVQVAPKLTGNISTDITDSVTYQTASFGNVPVTLDKIAYTAFQYRDVNQAISDINLRDTLAESAGITLIETMYEEVIRLVANNTYIGADQNVGTVGQAMNYNALRDLRTKMEKQHKISRSTRVIVLLTPDAYSKLTEDTAFQYQISADENTIRTGIISTVLNMEIYSDPSVGNTVAGGSMSISGTAGAIGLAFVPEAGVIVTRQIPVSDPSRQFQSNVQGISALYSSTYDASNVGGMNVQDKLEVLFGFQQLPVYRYDTGALNGKVYEVLGGRA